MAGGVVASSKDYQGDWCLCPMGNHNQPQLISPEKGKVFFCFLFFTESSQDFFKGFPQLVSGRPASTVRTRGPTAYRCSYPWKTLF